MNLKQIKVDHWYETAKTVGKCLAVSKTSAKFDMDGKIVWLDAKEVKYELPKDVAAGREDARERALPVWSWDDPQALKLMAKGLLCGLNLAVHHLENPGIQITPASMDNLREMIARAENAE